MTEPITLDPGTLRAYDIRGIVGETVTARHAYTIGRCFATMVEARTGGTRICLGYDGRLSSPELESALVQGLAESGASVTRVGMGPTPMLYFAGKTSGADGAIMITGSHNPPHHNGFKMVVAGGPFYGDDIQALGAMAASRSFREGTGSVADQTVMDAYIDALADAYRGERSLKVAWDAGNGAAGEVMSRLVERLPGEHLLLCETVDGNFPNHHPDPTVAENLELLIETVRREGCDMGVAFDGDGDRLGAVDGDGRILWGDQILALLAEDVLTDHPGGTVIADVKASQVLFDHIAANGGNPIMWRTGHSPIKQKMAETGAPLAGEMSGHIFFADRYYGFDDGLYAAVRLIDTVARSGRSAADLRASLRQMVNTPELRFECADDRKFDVVAEVADRLRSDGADVVDIDGVRVNTADGWWLLRASNTQPVLVARCESTDDAGLGNLKAALAAQLRASDVTPPEWLEA
jgi:phosphomannomutase